MIPRRRAIVALGAVGLATPWSVVAQQPPLLVFFSFIGRNDSPQLRDGLLEGLRREGYIDGRSMRMEWRFAERRPERLSSLASEVVALRPAVIITETTLAVRAAKEATATIPIVMTAVADALGSGLVTSLARPEANVTGMSFLGTELMGKRLELLKQALPKISTIAVLRHIGAHGETTGKRMREETERAARAIGLRAAFVDVRTAAEIPASFERVPREKHDAMLLWPSPMFLAERTQLARLASQHKVPVMYYLRDYVDAGGLMSYGPNLVDIFRRAATFVAKILRGAKPSDLPVEEPTTFELVVNLASARDLGIAIPESLLVRADGVVRR